jgi:uncharacterized protein YndB with AHSA1/START domain
MTESFDAKVTTDIHAPIDKVWDGITNPEIIAQYMGAQVTTDWEVGHPITWGWSIRGESFEDKGEILAVTKPHRLSTTHWSPFSGQADAPENYHVVTYDLAGAGDVTTLTLTQTNNPTQDAADAMARDGWEPMLQRLKEILEG